MEIPTDTGSDESGLKTVSEAMGDAEYAIYYRFGIRTQKFDVGERDHVLNEDGETLCNHSVAVAGGENVKPLSEVTDWEWSFIEAPGSNLCYDCHEKADHLQLFPEDFTVHTSPFPCPECEEPTEGVEFFMGRGIAIHEDGREHEFDQYLYDKWRRGEWPEKRTKE